MALEWIWVLDPLQSNPKRSLDIMDWTKCWVCFSDGTPNTDNIWRISCFAIFGPDGAEKGAFKHENTCSIAVRGLNDHGILIDKIIVIVKNRA